jgi:hypothetical protein
MLLAGHHIRSVTLGSESSNVYGLWVYYAEYTNSSENLKLLRNILIKLSTCNLKYKS